MKAVYRLGVAAAALFTLALVGCGDDSGGDARNSGNAATDRQAVSSQAPSDNQQYPNLQMIEIIDDGTNPRQLKLQLAQVVQLQVTNKTATDCMFFLGDLVNGQRVAAGQTITQSLNPSGPTGNTPTNQSQTVKMGCQGDTKRQGEAEIEFKGLKSS